MIEAESQTRNGRRKTFAGRVGRLVDEALSIVSPQRAFSRRLARHFYEEPFELSEAGEKGRPFSWWDPGSGSADAEILSDLDTVRIRSRNLIQNNGYARGTLVRQNGRVVGGGLVPHADVNAVELGISEDEAKALNDRLDELWADYVPRADAAGVLSVYGLQSMMEWAENESGEVLALRQHDDDNPGPIKTVWQIVEADRLSNPTAVPESLKIRGGIEIDARGRRVRYHIRKTHPGDAKVTAGTPSEHEAIPAFDAARRPNVLHLYRPTRPGQRRAYPWLAPGLTLFKQLDGAIKAELMAMRVQACQALVVPGKHPKAQIEGRTRSTETDGSQKLRIERLEPGQIHYTGTDGIPVPFTPTRPSGSFDDFCIAILRQIGASIGMPYEILVLDFFRRSYSSARAAYMEARDQVWIPRRVYLVERFCTPVWLCFVEEAWLAGLIKLPDFYKRRSAYCRADWQGPRFGWMDPDKEAKAIKLALELGLTTWEIEAARVGHDYRRLAVQTARETTLRKDVGLPPLGKQGTPNAV